MKVRRGLAFFLLLLSGSLVVAQNSKQQLNDQLFEAARAGDATLVASLLDKGADVNAKFRYGATVLFKAAERGHANVVKLLLERGADATIADTYYGATAMTWALDKGHVEVVKLLMDKVPKAANDVLTTGIREGNEDLVKAALAKTISPENLTAALIIASDGEPKPAMVELLKAAGAKPAMVLSDAVLESYVGKYKAENGTEFTITKREGGMLFASAPGQQSVRLFALDEKTFRPPAFEQMRVVFETEGNKATGFALIQGVNTPNSSTSKFKRVE